MCLNTSHLMLFCIIIDGVNRPFNDVIFRGHFGEILDFFSTTNLYFIIKMLLSIADRQDIMRHNCRSFVNKCINTENTK